MSIVNLNKARKAKARADKTVRADENAFKFGRSKFEKTQQKALKKLTDTRLDAHKNEASPKSE